MFYYACHHLRYIHMPLLPLGDPQPSYAIMIDGKDFGISQNLFGFLATTRGKATSGIPTNLGPYWIDALCIDQSSILERNHQVRQMGAIYSNAVQVDVWLGLRTWDRTTLITMLQKDVMIYHDWLNALKHKDELVQLVTGNTY